jgi:hypothetical protein
VQGHGASNVHVCCYTLGMQLLHAAAGLGMYTYQCFDMHMLTVCGSRQRPNPSRCPLNLALPHHCPLVAA